MTGVTSGTTNRLRDRASDPVLQRSGINDAIFKATPLIVLYTTWERHERACLLSEITSSVRKATSGSPEAREGLGKSCGWVLTKKEYGRIIGSFRKPEVWLYLRVVVVSHLQGISNPNQRFEARWNAFDMSGESYLLPSPGIVLTSVPPIVICFLLLPLA